jgi:hypothetical protein
VFVGNPADVVPDGFGGSLPLIRDWVEQNYQFSGYVTGISRPVSYRPVETDGAKRAAALLAELI